MSITIAASKFELNGQTDPTGMTVCFKAEEFVAVSRTYDGTGQLSEPTSLNLDLYNGADGSLIQTVAAAYDTVNDLWTATFTPANVGSMLGRWKSSDKDILPQLFVTVDAKIQYLMYMLRGMLDKSLKDRTQTWGFTDADLFMYLVQAMNFYNQVPPLSGVSIANIPQGIDGIIIDLATLYGIQAQLLYSIDTDVVYTDQGLTLTIDHFSKLSVMYDKMFARISDMIKKFKWSFKGTKIVMMFNVERSRGVLFNALISSGFPYFNIYGGLYNDVMSRGV